MDQQRRETSDAAAAKRRDRPWAGQGNSWRTGGGHAGAGTTHMRESWPVHELTTTTRVAALLLEQISKRGKNQLQQQPSGPSRPPRLGLLST